MSASSYLPRQTFLSQTSATPCPAWSWVSTGGKGWSWNKGPQPKRTALFADGSVCTRHARHRSHGLGCLGAQVAGGLCLCSRARRTSPCSAVLHPSARPLASFFSFFPCVCLHMHAAVCTRARGGWRSLGVIFHILRPGFSSLLVCERWGWGSTGCVWRLEDDFRESLLSSYRGLWG